MRVKNNKQTSDVWAGQTIEAGAEYDIQANEISIWQANDKVIQDLSSGDLSIGDGVTYKTNAADAVAYLLKSFIEVDFKNKSPIQKAIPVMVHKPEEKSFAKVTHDFTKKQTWYHKSSRVTGETLTGGPNIYNFANNFVIDVETGIVNRQNELQAYKVVFYKDGVELTDSRTIDFRDGSVTFDSPQTGVITADYSYATTSEWEVSPDAGKLLIIEHSEVQFTEDVIMNAPVSFEVSIANPYYGVSGHPLENDLRMVVDYIEYASIRDIINESNLGYAVPAMGLLQKRTIVFPFNYSTVKPLQSSYDAKLCIKSKDDVEMIGEYGTATFYLISKDEV